MNSASFWLVLLGIFGFAYGANAQMSFSRTLRYLDDGRDYSSIAFGDIDRDGDLDLFLTGAAGVKTQAELYKMNKSGFHDLVGGNSPFVAVRHGSADFEDVDNDGFTDLLITGQTAEGVGIARLYKNRYATFTEVSDTPFVGVTTSAAVFSDFNNDGAPDVIIAGSNAGVPVTNLYYNNGQGDFSLSAENHFTGVKGAAVAVADIDGDNDKDILIAGVTSESEYVSLLYRNEGGVFSQVSGTPFTGVDDGSLAFGDIDGDSDVDLMLMGIRSDGAAVSNLYRNNGSGVFSEEENTPFPLLPNPQVAMEDFDGDGDLDILMRGKTYITQMFTNDGTGAFSAIRIVPFTATNNGSFEVADLNRDGLPDILLTGSIGTMGTTTHLFRNTTVLNKPPVISEVEISGIPEVGQELRGSYTFFDEDGDEDQSIYRWYRSSYNSGLNKFLIFGASAATYSLTTADKNKYISFEITPDDGTTAGIPVSSGFIGPVEISVPDIYLTGNGVEIENGTGSTSLENHTLFGQTVYATESSLRTFVVENSGRAELLVSGITISGAHASEFALSAEIFPVSIAPGEEFQFHINFSPSEAGERHALLSIANNDADEEFYTFQVSGKGVNSPPEFLSEEIINFSENGEGNLLDVNAHNGNGGISDEEITYSITGGADADKFALNSETGFLNFAVAPDYELPADADLNNEYLVEITADDGHSDNNLSSQLITVVVLNVDEAPVALCAEAFTVQLDRFGEATITAADVDGGSSDDSGEFSMVIHPDRFTCAEIGENQVTLTVTDLSGNISTCTTMVMIQDNIPPEILTQNIEIHLDPEGEAIITPDDINSGSSDGCGIKSMSVSRDSFSCADVGPNPVTLWVTDSSGNETSGTAIVTVVDNRLPVIEVAGNIDVENQEGECGAYVDVDAPEISENCDVNELLAVRSDGFTLDELFPVGTTKITWTAKDVNGNSAEPVIQAITVSDTQVPVISASDDISVENEGDQCGAYVQILLPEVLENCALKELIGVRDDGLSLTDMFPVGTTIITWTAEDVNGNSAEPVIQAITVSDTQLPVISPAVDISLENKEGECGAFVQVSIPEVQENCALKELIAVRDDGLSLTDMFPVGTTVITWSAEDVNGNPAEPVIQNVIVSDAERPVIFVVNDITVENEEGECGAFVQVTVPDVIENCGLQELKGIRSDGLALTEFFPVGTTTITWMANDLNMNSATPVIQRVNITDNELPVAKAKNLYVELDTTGSTGITAADFNNGSYDNCGIKSLSVSHSTFTCADLGANEIILTVVDHNGNESKATATVFIIDNQLPEIEKVEDIDVASQEGECGAIVRIVAPEVTDNCEVEALIGKRNDDLLLTDVFPVGKTTITWSVKDLYGNEAADVVQTITVSDNTVPVISEAMRITAFTNGQCGAYVDITAPSVSDDCEAGIVSGIRDDGHDLNDFFPIGVTKITWTVTDVNNNDAIPVTQVIEVLDNERPVISAVDVVVESQPDLCGAFLEIILPEVTDNCFAGPLSATRSDELLLTDIFPVGETNIVWSVQDGSGNWAEEVVQKINVRDKKVPVISRTASITAYTGDQCGAYVDVIVPKVSDDCETGTLLGLRDDGKDLNDMFGVGTTIITWTVEDKNGNSAQPVLQEVKILNTAPHDVTFTTVDVPQETGTDITVRAAFQDENIASANWKAFNGISVVQEFVDMNAIGSEVSHTFYDLPAGIYTIILELKDHCGASSGEYVFEHVVIYDPNGGSVTGGGWFISPVYPAYRYMQKSGKANITFNAKYKKSKSGINQVGGNINFQFKTGDLHFKSSSYDDMSLVISDGSRATFTGKGTINGRGNYKFMLTTTDAEQDITYDKDLFWIKIWETDGNKVVYDNSIRDGVPAEADNVFPVTEIRGGSIVIHEPKRKSNGQKKELLVTETFSTNVLEVMQIVPNPMTGKAVVMFNLSTTSSEANLRIYDMNGKEVTQLFQGRVEGGRNYEVNFERGNLMSGIYICRLTTEKGEVYQKRLLLQ